MEANKRYGLFWTNNDFSKVSSVLGEFIEYSPEDKYKLNGLFKIKSSEISNIPEDDIIEIVKCEDDTLIWIKLNNAIINSYDEREDA